MSHLILTTFRTMLKKWFLSNNAVLCFITTKSTTPKFNNPLLHQFPISPRRFCTITATSESNTHPFSVSYLINNFGFSHESALKAFNNKQVRFNTPDNADSVITFFQNHGFPNSNIRIIIQKAPWLLSSQPHKRLIRSRPFLICSKDLINSLEEIKGLGFDPSTTTFGYALLANNCTSKKLWDEKVDVLKKWGWSDEDVIRAFRCHPDMMLTSIEKINLVMSFWVNQLGWDSLALTKRPHILTHSLEKWIVPRGLVVQFLLMKGLRKKNASLVTPFRYSEKLFLEKFVFSFKEESDYLLKIYEEKIKLAYTMENNGMPFPN
ncbi:mTERF protein [Medicago truncatula]|uniref:mTERF protein n=2 Tax=Medicago truncatula TaxID=3880 RepID=A0A072V5K7_MEDTR|nr:mTERF protein [Medicago truncatula]